MSLTRESLMKAIEDVRAMDLMPDPPGILHPRTYALAVERGLIVDGRIDWAAVAAAMREST